MNKVNHIAICKEDYSSQEDFENAIKKAVMVLLENNYIMTVRWDEKGFGILVIEFEHDDQSLGAPYPYWLTPDEWESVAYNEEGDEDNG